MSLTEISQEHFLNLLKDKIQFTPGNRKGKAIDAVGLEYSTALCQIEQPAAEPKPPEQVPDQMIINQRGSRCDTVSLRLRGPLPLRPKGLPFVYLR